MIPGMSKTINLISTIENQLKEKLGDEQLTAKVMEVLFEGVDINITPNNLNVVLGDSVSITSNRGVRTEQGLTSNELDIEVSGFNPFMIKTIKLSTIDLTDSIGEITCNLTILPFFEKSESSDEK